MPYEASPRRFCTSLSIPRIQNGFTNRLRNNRKMIFLMKRFCIVMVAFERAKVGKKHFPPVFPTPFWK